ncbi:MAG: peptidylprolyl isomerase [Chitinophagaceae bacterium]
MKSIIVITAIFFIASACGGHQYENPHLEIDTQYGVIELELYPKQAPKTVAAFLSYVDSGLYKNSSFYRVLNEDNQPMGATETRLIQGGIWASDSKRADKLPGIPHETTRQTGLTHKDGTLSLARQAPGTGNTEFFICVDDQPGFDYGGSNNGDGQGYAAFGKVVKGMDIVRKILAKPTNGELFGTPIVIRNIEKL